MENHELVKKLAGQKKPLPAGMDLKWESEEEYCSICLNDICGGDGYRKLAECGHGFHSRCIDVWLQSHATCPLCRAQLPQIISLNHKNQYYEWNDLLVVLYLAIKDFARRLCNPPLNDQLSSMLCGTGLDPFIN